MTHYHVGMRGIDGIVYINLDHRIDRKELIESEFERLRISSEKIHCRSAVYNQLNGTKGCLLSHIQSLTYAIEKGWEAVLILEDDIIFTQKLNVIENQLGNFFRGAKDQ